MQAVEYTTTSHQLHACMQACSMRLDSCSSDQQQKRKKSMSSPTSHSSSFLTNLVAGGCAGTAVDVALFPIDTIKTRMQAPQGFIKAGGFRGVYNGLASAAAGSAPGAALFFSSYEYTKRHLSQKFPDATPMVHMISAGIGETVMLTLRIVV